MKTQLAIPLTIVLTACSGDGSNDSSTEAEATGAVSSASSDEDEGEEEGGDGPVCEMAGEELCPCDSDAECLGELECLSGVCVRVPPPDDSTTETTGDTSADGDTGDTTGSCSSSVFCPDGLVCEPDGDCDSPWGQTYAVLIPEFGYIAGLDVQPEYFYTIVHNGVGVFEWPYFADSGPVVDMTAEPHELVIDEGDTLELRFWDYDSSSSNDFLTSWCPSTTPAGDCEPIDAFTLQFGANDEWVDGGTTWVVEVDFEVR